MNTINVTPFVDVMLVLLIVFMITSPMLVAGVSVDLPSSTAQALVSDIEPISITIDRFGNAYINSTQIANKDIVSRLSAISKENKNTIIYIRGDKFADYGKVISVVGLINASGFNKVSLVTELEQ